MLLKISFVQSTQQMTTKNGAQQFVIFTSLPSRIKMDEENGQNHSTTTLLRKLKLRTKLAGELTGVTGR